jgi:hypothetical protein
MAKAAFNRKNTFYQRTGLKFKGENSEVLHMKHSILDAENFDTSKKQVRNDWNGLKYGAVKGWDQVGRSCIT